MENTSESDNQAVAEVAEPEESLEREISTNDRAIVQIGNNTQEMPPQRVHITAVVTLHGTQRSREVETSTTTSNNVGSSSSVAVSTATVASSPVAPSVADPLAGGDNANRVMECLREIIQCPVCFTVPYGTRVFCCRNGHSCCRQCLVHFRNMTRTSLRRPFCPVCRTSMVRRKVFRNFVAEQIIAEYTAILEENGEGRH